VPVDDFAVVPFVLLLLIAAALVAAGLWEYRRRDAVTG
jgi:putative exporter of polyketide antibiotics